MNCRECEELIYTYPETEKDKQLEVQQHINECENCRKLFQEAQDMLRLIRKASDHNLTPRTSTLLTDKIMKQVAESSSQTTQHEGKVRPLFDLSISRWALAAVSCGILILFFIEVMIPEFESGKIKGPITNIQTAVIKSDDFRKSFTRPKKSRKKSIFQECRNTLSHQIDPNCVKEKINKINL